MKNRKIKKFLKGLFFYLGFFSLIRLIFPRSDLAVLRYHSVCSTDCDYASPGICVTPEAFKNHIWYFKKNYRVFRLEDAINRLRKGERLPKNSISITFDDGYQDNFLAYKILKNFDVSGTFFITTNCIDDKEIFWVAEIRVLILRTELKSFRLEWNGRGEEFIIDSKEQREKAVTKITRLIKSSSIPEREEIRKNLRRALPDVDLTFKDKPLMLKETQIREMIDGGMSIGGHTTSHCNLPSAGIGDAKNEIRDCKNDLEFVFGGEVCSFAYPNGGADSYYTDEILQLVEEAGFNSAFTSESGFIDNKTDFRKCPRFPVTDSLPELVFLLEGDRLRKYWERP